MRNPLIRLTSAIDGRELFVSIDSIDAVFPDASRDPERSADGSSIAIRGVGRVHVVESPGKVAETLQEIEENL